MLKIGDAYEWCYTVVKQTLVHCESGMKGGGDDILYIYIFYLYIPNL